MATKKKHHNNNFKRKVGNEKKNKKNKIKTTMPTTLILCQFRHLNKFKKRGQPDRQIVGVCKVNAT